MVLIPKFASKLAAQGFECSQFCDKHKLRCDHFFVFWQQNLHCKIVRDIEQITTHGNVYFSVTFHSQILTFLERYKFKTVELAAYTQYVYCIMYNVCAYWLCS